MTLEAYIIELEKLERQIPALIEKFLKQRAKYMLVQVKLRFANRGLDGDGNKIGEYTEATKKRKRKKGRRVSHVTLKDSGRWYDSLFVNYDSGELFLDSRMRDLTTKLIQGDGYSPAYGEAIMEFTDEEILVWQEQILTDLAKHLQKKFKTNIIIDI